MAERNLLARSWSRAMSTASERRSSATPASPGCGGYSALRATTGSRRAPGMPGTARPPRPRRCPCRRDGEPVVAHRRGHGRDGVDDLGEPRPSPIPSAAPSEGQRAGFHQDLDEDVPAPGPHRLPHPDLPGSLHHRHEHDVHDHHAAHHQRDPHQTREGDEEDAAEGLPEGHGVVLRLELEGVGLVRAEPVADPHDGLHLQPGRLQRPGSSVLTRISSTTPRGLVRRPMGERAGAMARLSSDIQKSLPWGSRTPITSNGTSRIRTVRPSGFRAPNSFSAVSEPRTTTGIPASSSRGPKRRPRSTSISRIRKNSGDAAVSQTPSTSSPRGSGPGRCCSSPRPPALVRSCCPDGFGILQPQPRPAPPLPPLLLAGVHLDRRRPGDRQRVQAVDGAGEVLLHVPVHALHDADHRDEEHDADDHAHHAEEALQLLGADLREREADGVRGFTPLPVPAGPRRSR
jgi:hypothetical protein